MKVGIVTWYKHGNLGSTLQAFSLFHTLKILGVEAEFVNFSREPFLIRQLKDLMLNILYHKEIKTRKKVYHFVRKNMLESPKFSNMKSLEKYAFREYDLCICGSDQIWALYPDVPFPEYYFLSFCQPCQRNAYAPSIGFDELPEQYHPLFRNYVNSFANVSVREDKGAQIIEEITGRKVPIVADPSLLISQEKWREKLPKSRFLENPYILCYLLKKNESYASVVNQLATETKLDVISIAVPSRKGMVLGRSIPVSPIEFVHAIRDAEYVFTDSFHGTSYSILFEKNLGLFKRFADNDIHGQNSRLYNLIKRLRIPQDIWVESNHFSCSTFINKNWDWNSIRLNLLDFREFSLAYLKRILGE